MSNPLCVPNLPTLLTFFAACGQYLNWFLQDSVTCQPINDSVITATLYTGSIGNLGTPVAGINGINIPYKPNTNGQYQALIPATFNPPLGTGYVLVVTAVTPNYQNMTWEIAAQVVAGTVRTVCVSPLITSGKFRANFPEFADPSVYPDSALQYWVTVACLLLNPSRWCDMLCVATELFVAHNLVLEAKTTQEALAGGWPGISKGMINSEFAGAVTVSYDTAEIAEVDGGNYNETVYGRRFLRLARMFGAGPIQVGPGGCGPSGGPFFGGVAEPNAWVGPWPFPGMSNFG